MINIDSKDKYFKPWWLLQQASDVSYRARCRELNQYNITLEQAAVLFIISVIKGLKKNCTPGAIAKGVLQEPATVSKILTRMEKQGLIRKIAGVAKKKEVYIELTEKGRQALIPTLKRESVQEIMSCLSDEERRRLCILLEKIRDRALETLAKRNYDMIFP